jgi:hypothetical protein
MTTRPRLRRRVGLAAQAASPAGELAPRKVAGTGTSTTNATLQGGPL